MTVFDDPLRAALAPRPGSLVGRAARRRSWIAASAWASASVAGGAVLVSFDDPCGHRAPYATLLAVVAAAASVGGLLVALLVDIHARGIALRGTRLLDYGVGRDTVDVDIVDGHPFRSTGMHRVLIGDPRRATAILDGFVRRDAARIVQIVVALAALCTFGTCAPHAYGCRGCREADDRAVATYVSMLRTAALSYRATHPDAGCVTPAQLRAEHEIDATANLKDRWGSPFIIECDGDAVVVKSLGADKKRDTADDIEAPPRTRTKAP